MFKPHKTRRKGNICKVCNSAESTNYIINYLIERIETEILTENSILFSSRLTNKSLTEPGFVNIFQRMNAKLYKSDMKWLKKQLELEKISKEKYKNLKENISKFHAHGLRKYFISTISSHSGNLRILKMMSGHAPPEKTDSNYVDIDKDIVIKTYRKMLPYLSFENTESNIIDDKGTKKLRKVEAELETLKKDVQKKQGNLIDLDNLTEEGKDKLRKALLD